MLLNAYSKPMLRLLRKKEVFYKDAQLIALSKAKDIVLAQLSDDIKDYINKNFGDVDT